MKNELIELAIAELALRLDNHIPKANRDAVAQEMRKWANDNFEIYTQETLITIKPELENDRYQEHAKKKMALDMAQALWMKSGYDEQTMEPNPNFRTMDDDFYPPQAKRLRVQMVALKNKGYRG